MAYPSRPTLDVLPEFVGTNSNRQTPAQRARLLEFVSAQYRAGRSIRQLAELTGRNQTAVRRALDQAGVPRRRSCARCLAAGGLMTTAPALTRRRTTTTRGPVRTGRHTPPVDCTFLDRSRKGQEERMPRNGHPDYVVDPDRGTSSAAAKNARLLDLDVHADRAEVRAGLRDLDSMTEGMTGLSRLQKDRERLFPRGTTAELADPRMRRRLPGDGQQRTPLSARQRNARSKSRRDTQGTVPLAQLRAQRDLVTQPRRWRELNDQLSEHAGDIQELANGDQDRIRRIDRSIQAYEQRNDRGHVVYSNVRMPWYINHQNLPGFLGNNFIPGSRVSFDRYTHATHQLHETASYLEDPDGRVAVFEIQTRRGAYLGQSDKRDNTQHLLPRGMEFEVVGVHRATYRTPDGSGGTRMVVQLRDVTPGT